MARNDYYTVYDRGTHFFVQKVDPDDHTPVTQVDNPSLMTGYNIAKHGAKASTCECWAGHKWCRHKQMVVKFQETNRINQRWLYNFDKNKWIEPLTQET